MAEQLGPKTLGETLTQLEKDVKDASTAYKQVTSITRDLQTQTSAYIRAQSDVVSALNGLKSPMMTSIANLITTNNINAQNIALEKQRLAQLQAEAAKNSATLALKAQEYAATQSKIASMQAEQDETSIALEEAKLQHKLALMVSEAETKQVNQLNEIVQERKKYLERAKAEGASKSELAILQQQLTEAELRRREAEASVSDDFFEAQQLVEKLERERASKLAVLNKELETQKEQLDKLKVEEKRLADAEAAKAKELEELEVKKLRDNLNNLSNILSTFAQTIRDTQNKLGISSGNALDVVMGNAVSSFKSFFSATTVSTEQIMAQQEAFQEQFGGVLTSDAAKNLAQQAKDLGVTGAQLASARRVFMTSTMGDIGQARVQQDQFMAAFREQGLTNKDAMNAIAQYSELYARNGSRFADSFARAAGEAKKIGVDLGKIDQVGDNIIGDFEGFLEKMAELGAMGFNLDAARLGEVAESGDTGALMTELRSQLAATGKDLTNLRRSEQLALSNAFGIPMAELQRLAAPTAGSGEQLTEQEQTNSILTIIAEKMSGVLSVINAVLALNATIQTGLLTRIATSLTQTTAGGLFKSFIPGFGGTAGQSAAAAIPAPTAGAADGATSGISKLTGSINPTSLIKGAAALVIMAGALFLMGKAMQQFKDVSAEDLGVAVGAIAALTLAMLALGALMTSGIGAVAVFAGIGAITLMAGAVYLLGKALQSVGDSAEGIGMLGTSFDSLATAMTRFNEVELNEKNVNKIKELATPTFGQNIANVAKSVEAMFTNAVAENKIVEKAAPAVDFTRLEAKLDQVVRAISSMEVKLDATKVGEIIVTNERRVASTGIFSSPRTS